MDVGGQSKRKLWWAAVASIAAVGLLLRVAAAQGGLWTDEAWSATYAAQAGDPLGVFFRINHDNNHHLISLWLQAVGEGAAPLLSRGLAILAGTAAIAVAALLVGRASSAGGIFAAVLFAFSPILVTYGSEARGYALMVLAALVLLLLVGNPRTAPKRPIAIALTTLLGMLSHLTMIAVVVLVTLWIYLERRPADGPAAAARLTAKLMGPALAVAGAVLGLVFGAAAASPLGMQVGGYAPFTWADYRTALDDLSGWTFGLSALPDWLRLAAIILAAMLVALRAPAWLGARGRLYAILILGVPLVAAVIQPGNIQFARYFLLSAVGMLLLGAEALGRMADRRGSARIAAIALAAVISLLMLGHDRSIVEARRGQPERIVATLRHAAPQGARAMLSVPRLEAVARLAARRADYRLQLVAHCANAEFVLADDSGKAGCGGDMTLLARGHSTELSGDDWALYRRRR